MLAMRALPVCMRASEGSRVLDAGPVLNPHGRGVKGEGDFLVPAFASSVSLSTRFLLLVPFWSFEEAASGSPVLPSLS